MLIKYAKPARFMKLGLGGWENEVKNKLRDGFR